MIQRGFKKHTIDSRSRCLWVGDTRSQLTHFPGFFVLNQRSLASKYQIAKWPKTITRFPYPLSPPVGRGVSFASRPWAWKHLGPAIIATCGHYPWSSPLSPWQQCPAHLFRETCIRMEGIPYTFKSLGRFIYSFTRPTCSHIVSGIIIW